MLQREELGRLYEELLPRIDRICVGMPASRGGGSVPASRLAASGEADDYRSVANEAFVKAACRFQPGKLSLKEWLLLSVQNAVRDEIGRKLRTPHTSEVREETPDRRDATIDMLLDLSADALELASELIAERDAKRPDRQKAPVLDRVRAELYARMSWKRFQNALSELIDYFSKEE